uniref:DEAD-box ATP-dependent RNA helicase, putative n=1 Tax=Tanacetum cinerariifolium TaxID=118510 RepID=A0A699GFX6_TANCI|nr:DEAD-box ATP-dependent RNA helicase, putative [Tanacetum cinerariifolium]
MRWPVSMDRHRPGGPGFSGLPAAPCDCAAPSARLPSPAYGPPPADTWPARFRHWARYVGFMSACLGVGWSRGRYGAGGAALPQRRRPAARAAPARRATPAADGANPGRMRHRPHRPAFAAWLYRRAAARRTPPVSIADRQWRGQRRRRRPTQTRMQRRDAARAAAGCRRPSRGRPGSWRRRGRRGWRPAPAGRSRRSPRRPATPRAWRTVSVQRAAPGRPGRCWTAPRGRAGSRLLPPGCSRSASQQRSGRRGTSWQLDLRIALERPFAVDFIDQLLHPPQAAFHFVAQRAQIGRGFLGVGAHGLRLHQHRVHFFQAVAGVGQQAVELDDGGLGVGHHALRAEDLLVGVADQAIGLGGQRIHGDQQLVGAFGELLCALVVAGDQAHGAGRAIELARHALDIGQAGGQRGIFRRQVVKVLQQVARGRQQARNFGTRIADQQRARGAIGQRRIGGDAGVGAQLGAAHQAPFERKNAGRAQPVGVVLRHVDQHARLAFLAQFDGAHAPDGKAGKRDVHAHHHAFGVVRFQDQALRGFERAARVHQDHGKQAHHVGQSVRDLGAQAAAIIKGGGHRYQAHGKTEKHDLEHQDQRDGRIEYLAHGARVAGQRIGRKAVHRQVGEDQRGHAAHGRQHPHGEDAGGHAREKIGAQFLQRVAGAGLAALGEFQPGGQGGAQRHEGGRAQRYEFEREHAHQQVERIAAEAIALRRGHHDADQHQAHQRRQHAKPGQVGQRVAHQVVGHDAAVIAAVRGGHGRHGEHHHGKIEQPPPAQYPRDRAPVQAEKKVGWCGQGVHLGILALAPHARAYGWQIAVHHQPHVVMVHPFGPHAHQARVAVGHVAGQFGHAHALARRFQQHQAAIDFDGHARVGDRFEADLVAVARRHAVLVDHDIVSRQPRTGDRHAALFQVRRRCVQSHAALDQVARDQVRAGGLERAHRQVGLAPREAGDFGAGTEHDADFRVRRVQAAHGVQHEVRGHGVGRGHAHDAGQAVVDALHLALELQRCRFHRLGGGDGQFAGRRGQVAGWRAQEQARAQRVLERIEAPAHGRLVDAQLAGGRAQRALAINGQKDAGVIPIHGAHSLTCIFASECRCYAYLLHHASCLRCRHTHKDQHDFQTTLCRRPRAPASAAAGVDDTGHRLRDGDDRRHRRQHGAHRHFGQPGGAAGRPGMGGRRLYIDVCRAADGGRRAGRPFRSQDRLPAGLERVHRRFDPVRAGAGRPRADCCAPAAGCGRRAVHAQFTEPAHPCVRRSGQAHAHAGHLVGHRGLFVGGGAPGRRFAGPRIRLAQRVLGERADRPGRHRAHPHRGAGDAGAPARPVAVQPCAGRGAAGGTEFCADRRSGAWLDVSVRAGSNAGRPDRGRVAAVRIEPVPAGARRRCAANGYPADPDDGRFRHWQPDVRPHFGPGRTASAHAVRVVGGVGGVDDHAAGHWSRYAVLAADAGHPRHERGGPGRRGGHGRRAAHGARVDCAPAVGVRPDCQRLRGSAVPGVPLRQDRHPVQVGEMLDVGAAHHGAVGIHQLAQHGRRLQAGHGGQVHRAFGMSLAGQYAARRGAQREHVARVDQVVRFGVGRDGGADGGHAVRSRDAGGHAVARFDRHRERRAIAAAVIERHGRQLQGAHLVGGKAQAYDAAAFADQGGHGGHGEFFGGDDQVRFVFAVEVVEQDHRHAGAHGLQRGGNAAFEVVGNEGIHGPRYDRLGYYGLWVKHVERSSHRRKTRQGKQIRAAARADGLGQGMAAIPHIFFHPDYTVGPGVAPGLLTPGENTARALAGYDRCRSYRRWGIAPRPEDVVGACRTADARGF